MDLQQEHDGHCDAHQRDLHHGASEEKKQTEQKNSWSKMVPGHEAPPTHLTGQSETGTGPDNVTFHEVSQPGEIRKVL